MNLVNAPLAKRVWVFAAVLGLMVAGFVLADAQADVPFTPKVADCGSDGLKPNTVVSCTYGAPNSTVVVTTSKLTNNLAAVSYYATRNGLNTYGSGDVVAAEYGAPSWANLQSAVAVANAAGRRLLLTPGAWPVTGDLTITAPVQVVPGATFAIATTKTLTMLVPEAGNYQAFTWTSTGKVVLTGSGVPKATWWGVKTDGTECSAALRAAATAAGTAGLPLELPSGTIVSSHSTAIVLSGIPEILGTNTLIDCSAATTSTVFEALGTKTLIGGPVAVANGAFAVTVTAGLYKKGDIILIAADEALLNTALSYTRKGGRHFVDSYTGGTTLNIYPCTDFAYTNAYIWRVTENNLKISKGISVNGNSAILQLGLRMRFCAAEIDGTWSNFCNCSVSFNDSRGSFNGIIKAVYSTPGAGVGYGASVNDLSEVSFNANISGARHAVASGGGIYWNSNELGGANAGITLPANLTVNGGFYASNNVQSYGAIDAHSCVNSLTVNGGHIVGGLEISCRYATVTGADIGFNESNGILFAVNNSMLYGDYIIEDCFIHSLGITTASSGVPFMCNATTDCFRSIKIRNNKIRVDAATNNTYMASLGGHVGLLEIVGNDWWTPSTSNSSIYIEQYGTLNFADNRCDGVAVQILPKATHLNLTSRGNHIYASPSHGINVIGASGSYDNFISQGDFIRGSYYSGLNTSAVILNYNISGLVARNNNTSHNTSYGGITFASVDALTKSITLSNNDLQDDQVSPTQVFGFSIPDNSSSAKVTLVNNNGAGCTSGNYMTGASMVVKAQSGNRATAGTVFPDAIMGSNGSLYKYNGSALVAFP